MGKINTVIQAFNRGRISPLALARTDLDRTALSAEVMTNQIPRTLGSTTFRPGWEYTGSRPGVCVSVPFVFSGSDLAEMEFSDELMRIWVDDELITRPAVTAAVANGQFSLGIGSWTDADESGATSVWALAGHMSLTGTGTNAAKRQQAVTVNEPGTVHALRIEIYRGPVVVKIGVSAGDDIYHSAVLKTGTHSLAFTPTGNFYIEFSNALTYPVLIDSVAVESAGVLTLPTPWAEADLPLLRGGEDSQSGDVVYFACSGYMQHAIERRDNDSWSVVQYEPEDGPFGNINISAISITPSAISGEITLTASKAYWKPEMVGELYKLTSTGQTVEASVTAEDTFTGSIFVTGIGSRTFSINISNTFSATVTLQRSTDDATWVDVTTYTAPTATTYNDALDNLQYYYRIGVKAGAFTSGTADLTLQYAGGSLSGVAKVTGYTSTTVVSAVVLSDLGGTSATRNWYRSKWSDAQGWPTAVTFYESRLWWFGKGGIWGSVVDGYESFDDEVEGDSGPINRTFGSGPVDSIAWAMPLARLVIGTATGEKSAKSTSFDEPLTPTNFSIKTPTKEGSASVNPIADGSVGLFVQRSGSSLCQLQFDLESNDYSAVDLSELIPEIGEPKITRIAIQKQPDCRIHCVRSDGTVGMLVKDDAENTLAWLDIETDGFVEDAYVFPAQVGVPEDAVYYTVRRVINGSTVRYREKWAYESNAEGGTTQKMADSFIYETGVNLSTITGLDHLEGESVILWGNGKDLGTYIVSSGSITPSETVTSYCVGLGYEWRWKSVKLAYGAQMGTSLLQPKRVNQLGLIARNIHPRALQYGPDFVTMYDMPAYENGQAVDDETVTSDYDEPTFPFGGTWDSDSRVCLKGSAPYSCTLLALVVGIETTDKG